MIKTYILKLYNKLEKTSKAFCKSETYYPLLRKVICNGVNPLNPLSIALSMTTIIAIEIWYSINYNKLYDFI